MSETEQRERPISMPFADSARLNAPDRYYAALFAPADARDDLIALAAFTGEIERIARQVSEAALGEIRVTWWRDAFLEPRRKRPLRKSYARCIRRCRPAPRLLSRRIEDYLERPRGRALCRCTGRRRRA